MFPYEEYRRGQREVSEAVRETVDSGGMLILEAPTGFGKTAAVLDGILGSGVDKRVLWVVRTVNEIEPVVRELRRFGVEFSFLMSARRICPLLGADMPPEDFWANCRVVRGRGMCGYYGNTGATAPGDVISKLLMDYREYSAYETAWLLARMDGLCPYFSLLAAAGSGRVVVATYPYLFREDLFEYVLDVGPLSDFVVVVDEAHSLLEAHRLAEYSISGRQLEKAIGEVERYIGDEDMARRLRALYEYLEGAPMPRGESVLKLDRQRVMELLGDVDLLEAAAVAIREALADEALRQEGVEGLGRVRVSMTRIAIWGEVLSGFPSSMVFAVMNGERRYYLATPMDPADVAGGPLSNAWAVVLMSGTIPSDRFAAHVLGVSRDYTYVNAEFHYGATHGRDARMVVASLDVSSRYAERGHYTYSLYANYVMRIADSLSGGKLVVYPSYEILESVTSRIPGGGGIVEERDTSLAGILEILEGRRDFVIHAVAGGKLVEGVEYVDKDGRSLISTVIVAGVPYPQPNQYTDAFIETLAKRLGKRESKHYVYTVSAAVKVRQAVGRAIRGPDDRAVVFLLDRRFGSGRLRKELRMKIDIYTTFTDLDNALSRARKHLEPRWG